jgi:DNA processing protein
MANDYNRDVLRFQVVTDKYSQGCNNLIKTEANVLTGGLVTQLGYQKESNPYKRQLFVTLEDDEQKYMIIF